MLVKKNSVFLRREMHNSPGIQLNIFQCSSHLIDLPVISFSLLQSTMCDAASSAQLIMLLPYTITFYGSQLPKEEYLNCLIKAFIQLESPISQSHLPCLLNLTAHKALLLSSRKGHGMSGTCLLILTTPQLMLIKLFNFSEAQFHLLQIRNNNIDLPPQILFKTR